MTEKQEKMLEHYQEDSKINVLNYYESAGDYLVIDYSRQDKYFYRVLYGVRGGFHKRFYYRHYDLVDKEPYGQFYVE